MFLKNNKGFTLIELVIIVAILAIITLLAISSVINIQEKSEKRQYIEDAKRFITLVQYKEAKDDNIKTRLAGGGKIYFNEIKQYKSPAKKNYKGWVLKNSSSGDYTVCLVEESGGYKVEATSADLNLDNAIIKVLDDDGNGCN